MPEPTRPAALDSFLDARPGVPGVEEWDSGRRASWAAGTVAVALISALFVCLVPPLRHWMVLPVTASAMLVAPDAVDWARKRLDTFHPRAAIALLGLHFFWLAPMLHVLLDRWPKYLTPVDDWRAALGHMALVNVAGLLIYRMILARPVGPVRRRFPATDRERLVLAGTLVCLASLVSFALFLLRFGGLGGYIDFMLSPDRDLTGYGLLFLATSSFPLVGFAVALIVWQNGLRRRPSLVIVLVILFVLAQFLTGGLQGSRSNIIWPALIAIGMSHLMITRVRRRTMGVALLLILGFMYLYGFYKSAGSSVLDLFTGARTIDELTDDTGRDLPGLLLGDLARADIQALTLQRQQEGATGIGLGVTYVGGFTALLPDSLGLRIPDKVQLGTEMIVGPGAFDAGVRSSRIYGLAGEATLNFGLGGAVLSFVVLGLAVRWATARYREAQDPDGSLGLKLLASCLPVALILLLGSDLDNLFWFLGNHVLALAAMVLVARTRSDPGT